MNDLYLLMVYGFL